MTKLTHRYTRALDQARVLFDVDVRKGTETPYLAHLLAVSAIVLEHGGTEDQAIAALLHDAGEDKGGKRRIASIRAEFGDAVADIVEACSDSLLPEGATKKKWWPRKVDYLDRLAEESADAALVSAADKLHNARSILADYRILHEDLWEKFNKDAGRLGTLWYYRRLVDVFSHRLDGSAVDLGDLLRRTVDELLDEVRKHTGADLDTEFAEACERERAGAEMNDNFCVRPVTAGGWDYIAAALVRLFTRLRESGLRHCVVVGVSDELYVQFMVRPDGTLWAESVGDTYLVTEHFDDDQHRALEQLGWAEPDPDGAGQGNYWREFPAGHDLDATVGAVLTCLDVFGCGRFTDVNVDVFTAAASTSP